MTDMPRVPMLRPLQDLLRGLADDGPVGAVAGVSLDSRTLDEGALFLACRGTRGHGVEHVAQAVSRGAAAVAFEPAPGVDAPALDIPVVAVADLSRHAGHIAARYYGDPSTEMHVIGITGTDGKTSTAHILAQALERLGRSCGYLGTLGSGWPGQLVAGDLTTPDPVGLQRQLRAMADAGAECLAMEVSSHALAQWRCDAVHFHTAVLTNVGRDHLDFHGSEDAYAAAKHRLFESDGLTAAVLNCDDARGREWLARCGPAPRWLGFGFDEGEADGQRILRGRDLALSPDGLSFRIQSADGEVEVRSSLLGHFNAANLLAAAAALRAADLPLERIAAAVSAAGTVPGRMEGFRGPSAPPLVIVDYAHTPQALEQALQAARAHGDGRLHVVFGCGGERDRGKRGLMAQAAARHADRITVTDDNPRCEDPAAIVAEIVAGFPPDTAIEVEHDRGAAISEAVRAAASGDVVLVAGKGHEDYQLRGSGRVDFSDRAFVAELLGQGER